MAPNHTSALFLIFLILLAAAAPLAHGQIIGGLTVTGQVCCTSTGNCPGSGVPGVAVNMSCNILGATTTVGQATTDGNGTFIITVPAPPGLALGQLIVPCTAGVQLPLSSAACPALSTTGGVLLSAIQSLNTVATALGLVQNAMAVGFSRSGV